MSESTTQSDEIEEQQIIWIFDSLVGFLRGPVWNIPIMTFIEQKSIIFEPGEDSEDEYSKVHEEYKNLVDYMLGSHMEDLGIAPEQFERVCGKATENIHNKFHQALFEQVWAADDYEIFRRMMTQKNIELQLQALELLAQKYGLTPESLIIPSTTEDDAIMEEVIKRSLEEQEHFKSQMEKESEELERAIRATLEEKSRLENERQHEKDLLEKAMKLSLRDMIEVTDDSEQEPQQVPVPAKQEIPVVIIPQRDTVGTEEIKRRQEYLREQRDKLLSLKRKEREKQLSLYEETAPQRPKTARAARSVIQQEPMPNQTDEKNLAFRRSLAARLKTEVVEQQKNE